MTEAKKIEATVIAIRESLMSYFKDGCVESLVENSNISIIDTETRVKYRWERREHTIVSPCTLVIGNLSIANLTRKPGSLTFLKDRITRSPQLTEVYKQLQTFMGHYLPGVEVTDA